MAEIRLPDPELRREARGVYGEDPFGYEHGRPDYPPEVFALLTNRCGLGAGTSVLEIGPGTGRVTGLLLERRATVVGVEPDASLVAYLDKSFSSPNFQVVGAAFEDAVLADACFDLCVAAMSFHWVDQVRGFRKLLRVVRPNGWVAFWWTLFEDPSRADRFVEASRQVLGKVASAPPTEPVVPFELDVAGWRHAFAEAGFMDFDAVVVHWEANLDPDQIRAFYGSMIQVRRRPTAERDRILDGLFELARGEFGGVVERKFVTAMYVARRP